MEAWQRGRLRRCDIPVDFHKGSQWFEPLRLRKKLDFLKAILILSDYLVEGLSEAKSN